MNSSLGSPFPYQGVKLILHRETPIFRPATPRLPRQLPLMHRPTTFSFPFSPTFALPRFPSAATFYLLYFTSLNRVEQSRAETKCSSLHLISQILLNHLNLQVFQFVLSLSSANRTVTCKLARHWESIKCRIVVSFHLPTSLSKNGQRIRFLLFKYINYPILRQVLTKLDFTWIGFNYFSFYRKTRRWIHPLNK